MRIINLIRDIQPIRMGVWMSATSTAPCLAEEYDTASEIWFPGDSYGRQFEHCKSVQLPGTGIGVLKEMIANGDVDPGRTVFVGHSPWGFQTRWLKHLAGLGYATMFVPHGTLEPWSMKQKALKKKLYFWAVEKSNILACKKIRALSKPEFANLGNMFPDRTIDLIPNGVAQVADSPKSGAVKQVLFMGRLHHKKGLFELAKGWYESPIRNREDYRLVIAGPDEGELMRMQPYLDKCDNASYVGPQYGEDKEKVLRESHYFILPSASEGFPVAVLEAAEYGLCPVISEGCNFPELLTDGMAIEVKQDAGDVGRALGVVMDTDEGQRTAMVSKLRGLISQEYSLQAIARQQFEAYTQMLGS